MKEYLKLIPIWHRLQNSSRGIWHESCFSNYILNSFQYACVFACMQRLVCVHIRESWGGKDAIIVFSFFFFPYRVENFPFLFEVNSYIFRELAVAGFLAALLLQSFRLSLAFFSAKPWRFMYFNLILSVQPYWAEQHIRKCLDCNSTRLLYSHGKEENQFRTFHNWRQINDGIRFTITNLTCHKDQLMENVVSQVVTYCLL